MPDRGTEDYRLLIDRRVPPPYMAEVDKLVRMIGKGRRPEYQNGVFRFGSETCRPCPDAPLSHLKRPDLPSIRPHFCHRASNLMAGWAGNGDLIAHNLATVSAAECLSVGSCWARVLLDCQISLQVPAEMHPILRTLWELRVLVHRTKRIREFLWLEVERQDGGGTFADQVRFAAEVLDRVRHHQRRESRFWLRLPLEEKAGKTF